MRDERWSHGLLPVDRIPARSGFPALCGAFQARVVNYADDFVILSRGKAKEALDWTRQVVTRLGLTLNEAKTSIKQARQESFHFLGYTFGLHCFAKTGRWLFGRESVQEERSAYQAQGGRSSGTQQRQGVVGGAGSTQSDSKRLVRILQLRQLRQQRIGRSTTTSMKA